jgi:hypothetical protein
MKTQNTTDTTTYINRRNELILVVHHSGPWAEYGELNSLTDHALNRYPTMLNIKTVNELLAYWGADAEQAA